MEKTYWMDKLKDIYSFMNFLKDIDSYKTFDKVSYDFSNDTDDFEKFLIKQNISFFEFYTSIISLYLSRISNSNGIIFSYSNITPDDTLFKIKYDDKISILDFIISVKNAINNALDNSMENLKNYVKDLDSDYCDYIFNYTIVNQTNENHIKNNIDSSIIFKISEESIEVEYDINTFSRFEIEAMLENIEAILYNCLNDMNQHCGDVNILCNRQLNLLNDFSKGEDFKLDDKLIPEIILEMAEKYPDNFAINDEINRITYKELVDLIPSLTYTLQHDYKIGKSDKIVLYLPRSYHVPLLTVCLMKLGAVTIPVDDSYPKDYIQSIINNSSPKYIIHELDYDFADVESIQLNDIKNNKTAKVMDVDVNLDDTALILYTSGSTGVPKGVEVTQRNIINITNNYFNHFNFPEGGRGNSMVLAKFTFVASLPIYGALMHGYETFIIRETTKESIAKFVKYLKTYHCYSMSATQELGLYLYNNFDLKLDNLSLAGSNLLKSDIRDDSSTVLWNAYGCTETSGSVIMNKLKNNLSDFSVIGKPLGNSRVYILDANKKQLPIGAIGELVIGGPVVTKQYFNNPEQTSKVYGEFNGERVYFTNDLAYFKPDGSVVYVGRKDDLINLNGFRIEPRGVESTISEYSDFNQIKVVVGKVNRQNHLIAYYSSDVDIDENNLKEFLSVHLPSYMVPSFYVRMDHLPLNPNGKIDVKCLPPVELDEVDFVKPRNELEEIVVNIFEKFFNQENISVYDNFIQLGGTSIIAMKIVKELDDYNLYVNDLISLGTPEKIAEHIQNNTVMDLDMGRYSLEEGCPLNESQLNVFLDIIRYEKNDVYNIPLTINIPGIYSADDLKSALFEMFNVHPILKSFINLVDGNPFLKTGFNPTVDYSNEYFDDVISDFMNKSFDIYSSLSRFLLVKKDDEDFVLVGVFHHLIFDGFSSLVFKQHLFDLLDGKVLKLDEGFVKSSVYNKKIVNTAEYSDAETFYESMLCEADDVSSFLSDVGDNKAGFYSLDLSVDKSDIDVLLKSLGVSENILFTGVFAYTLSRFTGDNKVLFNVLDNGRDKLSNYESIGMYVNTLPLLVDCSDKDLASFMDDIRDLIFNVFSYNFYPFRVLAQKFNINSSILFQYQPIFDEVNNQFFNVSDFEFCIFEKNNLYLVNVIYSGAFSSDTIRRFVESYNMILNQLLSVDKLSDINYISSSDLELLNTYNDTSCDLGHVDILDAFNDTLSRYPDNMLVSYEDRFYTYAEGAFIADKIAYSLKCLGVEMQDKVAFLVERSELYMFCVLGVLSTGAAYVPLDDAHPDERIKFILNDTSSKVVIVSDETCNRVKSLNEDAIIINISDIVNGEIGELSSLPTVEGDIACILYTSGSTGLPKGVKITRDAILNSVESYANKFKITNEDVYGLFATIGFNTASLAICQSFYSGACLSVVPGEIKLDMVKLNDYFIEQWVTHTLITTQVGKLYMETISESPLKVILVAGEKLGEFDNPNDYQFVNAFGLTEVFSFITSLCNSKKIDSSSIGMWNFNTKMYILDDELRRVPVGAVGELCISGYQISDGYLNREEENSKAFVKNPFDDSKDYNVLFRTGDMVRILPDGTLGIIGRRDTQVKIRGNRVELSEVESVIRQLDYVTDVTVQAVKHESNNELVAYVVVDNDCGEEKLRENVLEHVGESKPPFMVPSYVIKMDEIPLNVHGKVDKRALPAVNHDKLRAEYVAPTNDVEKSIVRVFKIIFDQDDIGILDDFVRLGGDSLTAIKVLSYLEEYNLSTADILRLRTPQAIAASIHDNDEFDLDVYSLKEGCPLNEPQLNVYLDIVANDKKDAYNLPFFMNISKDYSLSDIEEALDVMFDFHPILGMHVSDDFDVPYMVNGRKPSISVLHDIDNEFIRDFLTEPFDLYDSLSRFLIIETDDKYSLFAVFHHLVYDASSKHVFKRDLQTILDGGSIALDDSFLKVAAFNQQMQGTKEFKEADEFYASRLADSDDAGILLEDVLGDGPGVYQSTLEMDEDAFKGFLKECNISENILFTSVFAYTLSRFTGSDKVSFNVIENGRDRFDNFDSIGMYVNTLPILADCKNQSISSFMEQMSDLVYDVMRHNYYPFRLLTSHYDIDSSVIFQYLPEWIEFADNADNLDIENELVQYLNDSINDFTVDVRKVGESYLLNINYSEKFSEDMSKTFAATYNQILSQMIGHDKLSDISYVSHSDLELLDSLNHNEHPLDYDDLLDAFNDNLADCPDNCLVSYNDSVYTYGEGAFIADKIAKYLRDYGIETGDNVAFLVERSELYMFSVLGILSIGATYVPLDDGHPDDRIQFILEDTESKIVLVSDDTYERAKSLANDATLLNISDILKEDIGTLDKLPVAYGDVACMLYTSGTTGLPKGVKVTRKSILNISEVYVDKFDFDRNDVYGLFANISFDAGSWGICQTIYAGACLSIVPDEIKLDIHELNKYFVEHGVTHTMITTQVGKLFMSGVEDTSLEVLMVGGEKLGDFESPEDYRLIDGFGPTETFAFISSIDNNDKIDSSSIGQINHNIKFYVLDDEFRRVPCGAVGELYVSGYQLAQGYLNRDEETAKAFLANPFEDDEDYKVMYRTGDMVRVLSDGSLGVVGRRDSQVKIRGNHVELSEIEAVIREIDYVEDVTVQTIKRDTNNEVVAYVVVSGEFDSDELKENISDYVDERKPEYMIPSFVIELDEIPLNVNGKVDKRALPEVDVGSLRVEYVAPTTEAEKLIVHAFEEVFNQDKISIYDNFTHLGGDSLTAIKVLSYLGDYNVTATDILSLRTPFAIAENINKEDALNLDIYTLESGCPLNEPQLNVYLDIVANNKFDIYIIPTIMEIAKDYDVEDILNALDVMLDVHPILGMCVSDDNDVPYLVKGSKPFIEFKSDVNNDYLMEFLAKPFDLYDNLSRFLVVENSDGYSLYAAFHHIIFDALSDGVFKKDLQTILDGGSVEVDDSFLKVSAFSQQIQETEEYADAESFYDGMLADVDEVSELLDSADGDSPDAILLDLELDSTLFKSFLSKYNVSENVLFTSVFAYTLSRFAGSDKVLFNVAENGRGRFNNYNAIGMYVNTLPMLADCKDQNVSDFMEYMSDLVYDVMKYNYYPFRLLAKEHDIDSSILFQFMPEWIDDDADYSELESMEEDMESENIDELISELSIDIIQKGESYLICLQYSAKYSGDVMNRFVESYKSILSQIICVDKLSEINYVSDSDLKLLDTYNQTEYALKYIDILDAFNDNLAKYPDGNLVSYNENVYTYAEGAFIADKLANTLKELGVEKQDCVSFLVERSELYMFSVLGILSVGATYVPLDDAHPDDRIQFILEDTESKVVIVSNRTYERAKLLANDSIILNISDILREDIGTLSNLPVVYNDLGCILYTSGTTGLPKGVKVPRTAFVNLSAYYIRNYGLTNDDVFGLYSSIGFDAAYKAIFAAVYAGACLDVIPSDVKLDMSALNNHFIKQGINHVDITTQVAKLLITQVDDIPLDVLFTGGEKLGEFDDEVDCRFVDGYGPTEAYVEVSTCDVADRIDPSSIGHLVDNIKAYVLDDEFRRVPVGAVGELYLAGNQIADGYLNRDEETAKAFLTNPFEDDEDYKVMYRTGDMVRVLSDGFLGVVGRRDSQVKIRGNRVELSEIEAVIREIDYVDDVTVQTIKRGTNNEVVAYVVATGEFDDEELKENISNYVDERKPEYMIPSFVIRLDEIPLNVNGKVDKRALPEVDIEELKVEYVAPTTETEKLIVNAFEEVFNQENIGIYDDFVRMGGDSLTAIKMTSILSKSGISVNAHVIFDNKTPYQIAKFIDDDQGEYGFYLAKEGIQNQNMFILPPLGGLSMVFSPLLDNLEFEGNVYLIDDFKYDLTVDEIKNTDHNMTFEKYWNAIKDIFQDGDIIAGYSLGCLFAILIAEKLEKDRKIEKCVLIDGALDFYSDDIPDNVDASDIFKELTDLGFDIDELGGEDNDELSEKMVEMFYVNSVWDFQPVKINDTPVIYLATEHGDEGKLENIARNGEFIFIDDTDHTAIITDDVEKIVNILNELLN